MSEREKSLFKMQHVCLSGALKYLQDIGVMPKEAVEMAIEKEGLMGVFMLMDSLYEREFGKHIYAEWGWNI